MSALALTGGTVVVSWSPPRLVRGDVLVEGGRVRAVGRVPEGATRRDCSGCLVVPGNVCAHHHLYSALARGMPYDLEPPANFLETLQRVWWRLDRALDEELIRTSALAGGAEALLAGTTTVVDHHSSPNAIAEQLRVVAEALAELGVRAVVCYEVSDRDGPERAAAGLEENRRAQKDRSPLTRAMVGAHASFTLSEETLRALVALAEASGVGIHIHVAEDAADEADSLARFGERVVARLAEAGVLGERAVLAHCVHLDDAEVAAVRQAGAWVVHNPRSNMQNRVGRAPVLALGDKVALGTDGVDGDLFAEATVAYFRAREEDPSVGPGWALDRLAASARLAGEAFGEPLLGRVEPGAPADLVVLAYDPPTPVTEENLGAHLVFGISARHVRDVVVAGELVVADGRLARVDQADLASRSRAASQRLWERVADVSPHPFRLGGGG